MPTNSRHSPLLMALSSRCISSADILPSAAVSAERVSVCLFSCSFQVWTFSKIKIGALLSTINVWLESPNQKSFVFPKKTNSVILKTNSVILKRGRPPFFPATIYFPMRISIMKDKRRYMVLATFMERTYLRPYLYTNDKANFRCSFDFAPYRMPKVFWNILIQNAWTIGIIYYLCSR